MTETTAADWKAKGNAALSSGNAQEAVDCYSQAIALNPSDHVFYSNRSAAYLSLDDALHALEDAELCIHTKPDWPKAYSRKGAALHALKRYDEAVAAYEEGLKLDEHNAACLSGLTEVQIAQSPAVGANDQAFNPLANAFGPDMFGKIATNPRLSPMLSDASFVQTLQEIQRDPSKMSEHFKDPRVLTVLGELMGLNVNMGSGEEPMDEDMPAAAAATTSTPAAAAATSPTDGSEPSPMDEDLTDEEKTERATKRAAEDAKQRGNALYKQKQFSDAIACYEEAIAKDANNMSYYSNLAAVKLEMGQYDACIEDCKKAIEVGRANRADYALIAKAYVRIGNAHVKKGETEENLTAAIDSYENAQMENRSKVVERTIKALQMKLRKARELAYIDLDKALAAKNEGNDFFKNGEFPQAVERYTEAIKRDPSCAVYYANRAAAYTKLTSFNEAKKDCEKAIELDPKYVKAYSRMGAIQCFMKEFHKARESYEKGLSLDPNHQECMDGMRTVINKIQSGETDEERARHGMADPEIHAILRDPVMQNVLSDFQSDPVAAQRHMQNPGIMAKIEKLIAAGVVQTK
uniref:Hsp70-Hsp90 organising protein n=2 Tax=Hyaloperonospora arabidopsidis (strain Emoy2) TaxID=559515 RepID=M4BU69_HYAAE